MTTRIVRAPPPAVYRACSDPGELVRWRMPKDMRARLLSADGDSYRMSLAYPDGRSDTFAATFMERVANERVIERVRFEAPDRAGEMTVTALLTAVPGGTQVSIAYENLPPSIRPQDNEEGTREALARLAELLEPPARR